MSTDIFFGKNTSKNMSKMIFSVSGYVKSGSSNTRYYFKTSEDSLYFTGPDTGETSYFLTKVLNDDFYCRFVGDLQITKKITDKGDSGGWIGLYGPTFYSDDENYEQKLRDIKRSGWTYNIQEGTRNAVTSHISLVYINNTKNQWTNPVITDDILIPSWFDELRVQFATNTDLNASFDLHIMLSE